MRNDTITCLLGVANVTEDIEKYTRRELKTYLERAQSY
jgi:hypothetical protein